FNARWGDPETEVILPGIKNDWFDVGIAMNNSKKFAKLNIISDGLSRVVVAGVSRGYPEYYSGVKGKEIFGIADLLKNKDIQFFGAGIKYEKKHFYVNGGRLFYIVGSGTNNIEA